MNDNSDYNCYKWLADCATTSHIAFDESLFSVYRKADRTIIDGKTKRIVLHDVLHVPTATDNLLSVGRYEARGGKFETEDGHAYFYSPRPE
ncbi:hypothetical protein M378DRAFT_78173 [Amanita muscaria Koide BX008]|uniref:Uncharacterized protein n=1 Tax=Amanita muscaria (strain Koide BX008) TaxID=946122 RepID=A0A0C2SMI4_AMAMK|nr:hypothetical protein M378DRAFT_78173 [Amanita muscaria Koide BX008]